MTDRGYGRISKDTEQSGSIDKQKTLVTAFANEGMVWYEDRSVSGAAVPFAERPGGKRLMAELQKGDRLIATRLDRVSRSVRDLLELAEKLDNMGVTLTFTEQPFINTSDSMGRFTLTLLGALAELEAAITAERRRESMAVFKDSGRHAAGKPPLGWKSVPAPTGRGLVIAKDPEKFDEVEKYVRGVLNGTISQNQASIELGLTAHGFGKLLRSPRLAGMTPDNVYETYKDPETGRKRVRLVSAGVVMTDSGVPRIDPDTAMLTMTEYKALQAKFKNRGTTMKREGYGAILECGTCGERMYYQKQEPRARDGYRCNRYNSRGKGGGPHPSVAIEKAHPHIEAEFLKRFGDRTYQPGHFVDDDSERMEAIALADEAVERAQTAQKFAHGKEARQEAAKAVEAALEALDEAEALPDTARWVIDGPVRKVSDFWKETENNPYARNLLIGIYGRFVVNVGRIPIEEKVVFVEMGPPAMTDIFRPDALTPITWEDLIQSQGE